MKGITLIGLPFFGVAPATPITRPVLSVATYRFGFFPKARFQQMNIILDNADQPLTEIPLTRSKRIFSKSPLITRESPTRRFFGILEI